MQGGEKDKRERRGPRRKGSITRERQIGKSAEVRDRRRDIE
jgi:hypothetical protein